MEIIKVKDYDEMSAKACSYIIEKIKQLQAPVLGLATGSTPEGLYKSLIQQYNEQNVSFNDVSTFNLDEYVGLENDDPNSYHFYMNEKLFKHIDIEQNHIHIPNGVAENLDNECQDYEQQIMDAEKVDIQILGLGLNGHIGFNEPGTPFSSRTHIVDLDESTRKANARFFDSIEEVPKKAITMGLDTIMQSKEILLLVSGASKREALDRLLNGDISEEFPASILQQHEHVTIIADKSALEG
ncbi:glucosamine-6-phosphate deaminase [Oceanobacillus damuensis]|uniref:glucosamine-6-phosphate deaminase n=1 Tax=Oceanobacillus damuensis TaxID=937928 RepID=UPI00083036EB|nr:glucosamine-6-phosphate deaminase [Oceanobacillus damuensis]